MRFVRWLGAFGKPTSLTEAAAWEKSQVARQVAVEPLWHGRSLIRHVTIGLEIDQKRSIFCRAWLKDAWTEASREGILKSNMERRGKLPSFRNLDRFCRAWAALTPCAQACWDEHAEAVFDLPVYTAVVVKSTATEHGKGRARRLSEQLNLPLRVLP